MADYKIRKKAEEDLENIWKETVNKFSENQAETYLNGFFLQFDFLNQNPKIGKKYSGNTKNFLYFPYQTHIIFYKILENQIDIYRIVYKGMLFSKHIK